MESKDKSIKIIILVIIFLIISCFIFSIIYLNISKTEVVSEYDEEIESNRVVLEKLSYEIVDNEMYNIYDSTDTYITTVYSNEELAYYIENPDFRPIYNDADDDEDYYENLTE